jgi:hypothetical protein
VGAPPVPERVSIVESAGAEALRLGWLKMDFSGWWGVVGAGAAGVSAGAGAGVSTGGGGDDECDLDGEDSGDDLNRNSAFLGESSPSPDSPDEKSNDKGGRDGTKPALPPAIVLIECEVCEGYGA